MYVLARMRDFRILFLLSSIVWFWRGSLLSHNCDVYLRTRMIVSKSDAHNNSVEVQK